MSFEEHLQEKCIFSLWAATCWSNIIITYLSVWRTLFRFSGCSQMTLTWKLSISLSYSYWICLQIVSCPLTDWPSHPKMGELNCPLEISYSWLTSVGTKMPNFNVVPQSEMNSAILISLLYPPLVGNFWCICFPAVLLSLDMCHGVRCLQCKLD